MVNKRTPKRQVTRVVNKGGYTNRRSGKHVGPYKRKMKVYPKHYFTMITDPRTGKERLAEVWVKGRQRKYRWVEDHRKAQLIELSKAKKHFESLPKKRQEADLRKTSKNQLKIIEKDGKEYVKESYLTESGSRRYDIKGIDTKIDDFKKKESKEIQLEKPTKKEWDKAETELRNAKNRFFKKDELTDKEDELVVEIEGRPVILDYSRISMLTTSEMFEGTRIDRITTTDRTDFKGIPDKFTMLSDGDRYIFDKNYNNHWDLDKVEKITKKMDPKTLEIYYGSDDFNKGFSPLIIRDKDYVYALAPRMLEASEEITEDEIKQMKRDLIEIKKQKERHEKRLKESVNPEVVKHYQDLIRDDYIRINELDDEIEFSEDLLEDIKENIGKKPLSDVTISQKEYNKLKKLTKEELIMLGDFAEEDKEKLSEISRTKDKLIYHVLERQLNDPEYKSRKKP